MTFESGFVAFTLLVIVVALAIVAHATFTAGPRVSRWHKPVGVGILGVLSALGVFLAWFALAGGTS